MFDDRLISRFGPVNWPPSSCDLTPRDYFLWGYVKSLVYADKPQTFDHFEDNIRRVIADIRPQMLEKVIENWTPDWTTSEPAVAVLCQKSYLKFNGDRYRALITNFFIPELNNHDVQELLFQQDGTTYHTARATIDLLKDTFGDRLISRFGRVNWTSRSCDLTTLDYFLWGYVKSLIYEDKPQTVDHLKDNIRRFIADIRPQMLEKVIENWTSILDYIRASRGSPMPDIIFKIELSSATGTTVSKQTMNRLLGHIGLNALRHVTGSRQLTVSNGYTGVENIQCVRVDIVTVNMCHVFRRVDLA
ncbi:uncharacterized protein TNCV_2420551 [Trichonephila clavipes]|uniref:Uncharacterized protein n=1 Tax=Trichonephila clavipes TaxID=2585209 RepID=A0A8X6R7Z2_TRICX|nr:uncharacterized protein TNCV_2420551 [Trichonephila clavipes]